jgi:large subunit ribosomal protein L19e
MNLNVQKRIAASILKCSKKRIVLDQDRLKDIKEAITKEDLRGLIAEGAIQKVQSKGVSRVRAQKIHIQRRKGRMKGDGSRKGTAKARTPPKRDWINKVRLQRKFLTELKIKGLISSHTYRELYLKVKGGFFRTRNHLKYYIDENRLFQPKNQA